MLKIDKRYTIAFSKGGINQYAKFYETKGKVVNPRFNATYTNINDIPSVEGLDNINDILEVIKEFSYNSAEIIQINGVPINYYNNSKVKDYNNASYKRWAVFVEKEVEDFFMKILRPLMDKYGFKFSNSHLGIPILIHKDENNEWDNARTEEAFDFEYICYKFISTYDSRASISELGESKCKQSCKSIPFILKYLNQDKIEQLGYYINPENL